MTRTTISHQPNLLAPLLAPLSSPPLIGCFGLIVLIAILSVFTKRRPLLSDGRFVTRREIGKGRKKGLRQIAQQVPNKAALACGRLVLSDLQPSVAVIGRSRGGKTRSIFDPGLKSAIDQEWTLLVLDTKGSLMQKHAAYAHAKGFDVYVYAAGQVYSDGFNTLDTLDDPLDAKAAQENATVLNLNFQEPGTKSDDFFGPQGIALLKLVFMLAKQSPFPDLLMAWKILSLDNLAERLNAAKKYGLFDIGGELGNWVGEAAVGLRSVAHAEETSVGIVGSAVTHFQSLVDRSILPSLLKSTIPLDLPGKQIIFFQIDEQNQAATSPLVAMAIHMLVTRNLNATTKRERTFGVFLDEFTSARLPKIEAWTSLVGEYGAVFLLGYQSDAQIRLRYSRDLAEAILSNCGTKIVFNTGHSETAEKFSTSLGYKDVWYETQSQSHGSKNNHRTRTEQVQKVLLISGPEINCMEPGECVILSPGFGFRPYKLRIPIKQSDDRLWERCSRLWKQEICPMLIEQNERRLAGVSMEIEMSDREVIAKSMLPTALELETLKHVRELRARASAVA